MATDDASRDAGSVERIISLIDLTDLDDAHRPDGIDSLLADARRHGTAAVCVWPEFAERSAQALAGSGVRVATVVNFPAGTSPVADVDGEVAGALDAGADEIDLVLPWPRFVDGDVDHARAMVQAVAVRVHDVPGAALKVILETGDLPSTSVVEAASRLAVECGADFLKTSTGKTGSGASPTAVSTMLEVIAESDGRVGVKPSGGIKTVADAIGYLDLADRRLGPGWATTRTFRFGASGLLTDALRALGRA